MSGSLALAGGRSAGGWAGAAAAAGGGGPDIVSMLISIYGTQAVFMQEYQLMLAERLLAKGEYDCEREIRTLELLKIRWGRRGWAH